MLAGMAENTNYIWPISLEWRREFRRVGGGLLTVATISGVTWLSATQTFVTKSGGRFVHPDWNQWPFWLCMAAFALGLYVVLATFHDGLWMPGRVRTVDHETRYSLGLDTASLRILVYPASNTLGVQVTLSFLNAGDSTIRVHLEDMNVEVLGVSPPSNEFLNRNIKILPHHTRAFMSPQVVGLSVGPVPVSAEAKYQVTYSSVRGGPVYRRTHAVAITTKLPITEPGQDFQTDWWDLEDENDAMTTDGTGTPVT